MRFFLRSSHALGRDVFHLLSTECPMSNLYVGFTIVDLLSESIALFEAYFSSFELLSTH